MILCTVSTLCYIHSSNSLIDHDTWWHTTAWLFIQLRTDTMKNILVVTWTRAEYGLLYPLMKAIRTSKNLSLTIGVTWMHLLDDFWKTANLITQDFPDTSIKLIPIQASNSVYNVWADQLRSMGKLLSNEYFDIMLVLWDRIESMIAATAAAIACVPVAHLHWWETTWWQLPDDYFRNMISKGSHIHFTSTETYRKNVISIWENPEYVYNVWAIWLDPIYTKTRNPKELCASKLKLNPNKKRIIMLQHPVTFWEDHVPYDKQIRETLDAISLLWDKHEVICIYPNNDTGSVTIREHIDTISKVRWWHVYKNLPRDDYLNLCYHSDIMLGNSSSGILESAALRLPVINIWPRQLWRLSNSNVVHVKYDSNEILQTIHTLLDENRKSHYLHDWLNDLYYQWWAVRKIMNVLEWIDNYTTLFSTKLSWRKS